MGNRQIILVSGEYPQLGIALRQLGFETIETKKDARLPKPIQWHPDMQASVLDGRVFTLKGGELPELLKQREIPFEETDALPESCYPKDVLCNVLAWEGYVLGNPKTVDQKLLRAAEGRTWISVRQGYAACSTALVDEQSAITADMGIAAQLERCGMKVLRIQAGHIRLPGYSYGFIGGCCGKLSADVMAFVGSLERHPDAKQIQEFLDCRHVSALSLTDGELLDVGGMFRLPEIGPERGTEKNTRNSTK